MQPTRAWRESRIIPTYPLPQPDEYPMFFEKRVYQGSSGKVYPLPFYSAVSDEKQDVAWDMWTLENQYVRLELLPELGGRIWRGLDTTNDYDFFYDQPVIKPALVGLAGPWISGGVEFNWPQHHRPATYLPCDATLEEHDDGSRTVWMSDHDPMVQLQSTHGITVRPGSCVVEMNVRLYNRTPYIHTFLWWANVAAEVHDQYQSFFPPDVGYVADHAVRAMSSFPMARNLYYGVDYRPGTDLSWYKNIPVPTSYMITQTDYNFFGGYDHKAQGGFVHVANRHISPGKKQWTWGNHDFGWAWDRELTDAREDGSYPPYVELMAGVYTDNQPDFSYLMPYETKTFTQVWWPYQKIGPLHNASRDFGMNLNLADGRARIGICASSSQPQTHWLLRHGDSILATDTVDLSPDKPVQVDVEVNGSIAPDQLTLEVLVGGKLKLAYQPPCMDDNAEIPPSATEPPSPSEIATNDVLHLTAEHLEQYRHPTRDPDTYWLEALERDPGDARANAALGRRLLQRGRLAEAERHLRGSIERLTHRHPNPETGEPLYFLGLCLKRQGKLDQAYRWFYKATWNYAWRSAGYYQLALIDVIRQREEQAIEHLEAALETNASFPQAKMLRATLHRRKGDLETAQSIVQDVLSKNRLDAWALFELAQGESIGTAFDLRPEIAMDLAFDLADAGLYDEALIALGEPGDTKALMHHYTRCWLMDQVDGDTAAGIEALTDQTDCEIRWCFAVRYHESVVLEFVIKHDPQDAEACVALGNYHYDKRNYDWAIAAWERALERYANHITALRNLGIARNNIDKDAQAAQQCLAKAHDLAPKDAQILSEYDQLLKRNGSPLKSRLERLETNRELVFQRDDLTVEYIALLNLTGQAQAAADTLAKRRFHPWEGGEGKAMSQHVTAYLALAREAIRAGDHGQAIEHADMAMSSPERLGEAKHRLANVADILFHRGVAKKLAGDDSGAEADLEQAAAFEGDFLEMAVQSYSEKSFFSGMAMRWLLRDHEAEQHFMAMHQFGHELMNTEAKIDYFATSLPDLLVFEDDLQRRRTLEGQMMVALADVGLGHRDKAGKVFEKIIALDPSQALAQIMLQEKTFYETDGSLLWKLNCEVPRS